MKQKSGSGKRKSMSSYLRRGILYTASFGIAVSATPYPTSDKDYRHVPAIECVLHAPKVELNKYSDRLYAEAKEIASESYKDTGHYDIERLRGIQQLYFDYLRYTHTSSEEPIGPLMPTIGLLLKRKGSIR